MASPASIPVNKTNFKNIQLNKIVSEARIGFDVLLRLHVFEVKEEVESDSDCDVHVFNPPASCVASPGGRSKMATCQSQGPKPPRAPIRFTIRPVPTLSGGNATQISNTQKKPRDSNNNSKGGKRGSQDQPGSGSSKAKGVEREGEGEGASATSSQPVQSAPSTLPNKQLVSTKSGVSLIVKESRVVKSRLYPVQQQPATASHHAPAMQTMILPLMEARRENELNMEKNKGRIRLLEDDVDRLSKDKHRLEKDMDDLKRWMARREERLDRQMNLLEKRLLSVEKGEKKRKERKRGGSCDSDEGRHRHGKKTRR